MSNWIDVRIKITAAEDVLDDLVLNLRRYFSARTRRDPNAPIQLGPRDQNFVWCMTKKLDGFMVVLGNTRTGFGDNHGAQVMRWLQTRANGPLKSMEINIRDDGSHIFKTFTWDDSAPSMVRVRWIDPLAYPELGDQRDLYNEETSSKLMTTLFEQELLTTVDFDHVQLGFYRAKTPRR